MNPLSLILGFLPLIAFNILAGRVANNGIAWGALVALAIALINMAITRPRWPPKIINLISASLFLVLTLTGSWATAASTVGSSTGRAVWSLSRSVCCSS